MASTGRGGRLDGRNLVYEPGYSDMVMGFLEEDGGGPPEIGRKMSEEESAAERKAFWEQQHHLLKGVLCRSSSGELKIRNDTELVLRESRTERAPKCECGKEGWCRNCLLRDVTDRLRKAGYDSAICKSRWRTSPDIPSGEHSFIDVEAISSSRKAVRVVIELDFRDEFKMGRASREYNRLIERLPKVFVGRTGRLEILIKILCDAAKKCMKENRMHMGPWRTYKYMHAKWLGKCERMKPAPPPPPLISMPKLRPSMHCPPVEAVGVAYMLGIPWHGHTRFMLAVDNKLS